MSARDELVRFLETYLAPAEIAHALRITTEWTNETFATGHAMGLKSGREACCSKRVEVTQLVEEAARG